MTETKPAFAKLTDEQKAYMERVQIGDMFVTPAQIDEIADTFALDGKTEDELRAIRNSVVKYFGAITSAARTCGSWKSYDRAHNALSGITAVIDHALYFAGAAV